jgi:hypothetical protein
MPNATLRTACRWLLWAQIALTVAAVALAAVAVLAGSTDVSTGSGSTVIMGAAVSSSLLIVGAVLLVGGGLGLVAVRRGSRIAGRRAGLVLITPAVLAVGSIPSGSPAADPLPDGAVPAEVLRSLEQMLALLTWAHRLAFGAVVLAAASATIILLSSRRPSPDPGTP